MSLELTFSSLVKIIKDHAVPSATNQSVAQMMLDWIIDEYQVETNYLDPSVISRVISGKVEVPIAISECTLKSSFIKRATEHFDDELYDVVHPQRIPDFWESIKKLVMEDGEISSEKRQELLETKQKGDIEFFSVVFTYALARRNVQTAPEKDQGLEYVFEVNSHCPLCGDLLVTTKKTKKYYNFKTVKIGKTKEKIALCLKCADNYQRNHSDADDEQLLICKSEAQKSYEIQEIFTDEKIDERIQSLLYSISENIDFVNEDTDTELSMIAINIDKKIKKEFPLLKSRITTEIGYYTLIRNSFNELQQSTGFDFELFSLAVKKVYLSLCKKEINQQRIYIEMSEWILGKSKCDESYRLAAELIVSFFIQNCEVFYDLTK